MPALVPVQRVVLASAKVMKLVIARRERFDASTSLPFLYGQRVKMTWKDAADPTRGEWYEGTVSMGEEWGHGPGAIWEGVSVMWDIDRSKPSQPDNPLCLAI